MPKGEKHKFDTHRSPNAPFTIVLGHLRGIRVRPGLLALRVVAQK